MHLITKCKNPYLQTSAEIYAQHFFLFSLAKLNNLQNKDIHCLNYRH